MDVTRIYKSIRLSIATFAEVHDGIQRIGKTVGKHPELALAVLQSFCTFGNLFLHGSGTKRRCFSLGRLEEWFPADAVLSCTATNPHHKKVATIGSLNHPGSRSQNKTETNLLELRLIFLLYKFELKIFNSQGFG